MTTGVNVFDAFHAFSIRTDKVLSADGSWTAVNGKEIVLKTRLKRQRRADLA